MKAKATSTLYSSLPLRERLIIAAERDVALHGLRNTRVQRIVRDAGSQNLSAIHYHFGTQEKLFESVALYRAKVLGHFVSFILDRQRQQTSILKPQHYLYALFAPQVALILLTLPAPFSAGCAEQFRLTNQSARNQPPELNAIQACRRDLQSTLAQTLGEAVANHRVSLGLSLAAGVFSEIEREVRLDQADIAAAGAKLEVFLFELIESVAASMLQEHYRHLDRDQFISFVEIPHSYPEGCFESPAA